MERSLERLIALIGRDEEDTEMLFHLLEMSESMIKAYTNRKTMPDGLESALILLAAVLYDRRGMEGEKAHYEGSVRIETDGIPEEIKYMLRPYMLAKTVN